MTSSGKTVVIVQAHMSSSRLPGKVIMDLMGRPVLYRTLERCAAIPGVDEVCCAISKAPIDDPLVAVAESAGASVFRGSDFDVLGRYYWAARDQGAQTVLRVTSDCPLLDPWVCGRVLDSLLEADADYSSNNSPPSWPHGLDCEAITMKALSECAKEAYLMPDREHVTQYIRRKEVFKKVNVPAPLDGIDQHRWTLDTQDDLDFMRAIMPRLKSGPEGWHWEHTLAMAEAEPSLVGINAGHDRNSGVAKSWASERRAPSETKKS